VAAAVLQNSIVRCVAPMDPVFSHRKRKHYCQVLNLLSFESVQHFTEAKKNTPPTRETP